MQQEFRLLEHLSYLNEAAGERRELSWLPFANRPFGSLNQFSIEHDSV